MDFMDVPDEAIEELRGIGQDFISNFPDWIREDAELADSDAPAKVADVEASAASRDSEDLSAKEP